MTKWTPAEDEVLNRMRDQGYPLREIAFELDRPIGSVDQRIRRLGLAPKRHAKAQPSLRPAPDVVPVDPAIASAARETVRRYAIDEVDAEQLLAALGIAS